MNTKDPLSPTERKSWRQIYYSSMYTNFNPDKAKELKLYILKKLNYSLFRYRNHSQREVDTVAENKIWFSLPKDNNDPFEFYCVPPNNNLVSAIQALHSIDPEFSEELLQFRTDKLYEINQHLAQNFSICCFNETPYSELMWSHYASSHTGICIEYDFAQEYFNHFLQPVFYTNKVPVFDQTNENADYMQIMTTKSDAWSYENEWRLIYSVKHKGLQDAPPVKAIYLGSRMKDVDKETWYNLAKKKNTFKLYELTLSKTHYELCANPIFQPAVN